MEKQRINKIVYSATTLFFSCVTEGYVHGGKYNYFRKDHLGNNREVWQVNGNEVATIQRTDYYPSGLPWAEGEGASVQPYKHNSKEFIEMHGYDVTYHGNRGLFHAINRYTTMDRFAEKFPWQSPYVHAANNPVRYVDVGGDSVNVAGLLIYDKMSNTNNAQNVSNDLQSQTGLTVSISTNGQMAYKKMQTVIQ